MATHVALLRGINLGSVRKVPMKELRAHLEDDLGLREVRTYIQSGNVVFEAPRGAHGPAIRALIAERFGHDDVPVLVRSAKQIARVAEAHPFQDETDDHRRLAVTFLEAKPRPRALAKLREVQSGDDAWEAEGREVYLFCPDGYGRTKLSNDRLERVLETTCTSRNLRTVRKLAEMASE